LLAVVTFAKSYVFFKGKIDFLAVVIVTKYLMIFLKK